MIIRECLVDIRDIRGIPFSNSFKGESILLYAHIHIVNDDGFPLCGLLVNLGVLSSDDAALLSRHLVRVPVPWSWTPPNRAFVTLLCPLRVQLASQLQTTQGVIEEFSRCLFHDLIAESAV